MSAKCTISAAAQRLVEWCPLAGVWWWLLKVSSEDSSIGSLQEVFDHNFRAQEASLKVLARVSQAPVECRPRTPPNPRSTSAAEQTLEAREAGQSVTSVFKLRQTCVVWIGVRRSSKRRRDAGWAHQLSSSKVWRPALRSFPRVPGLLTEGPKLTESVWRSGQDEVNTLTRSRVSPWSAGRLR